MPTAKSDVYRAPIDLSSGGTINAALVGADGRLGMMGSMHASGYAPKGWKVIAVDDKDVAADSSAANAIDAKPATVWQINDSALPHSLTD